VKLVIQIPCLNEREHLPETLADLPRHIDGIDEIEVVVIDDGSTDGTSDQAAKFGVHYIVRFPRHRGLAAVFMAGVDASLRLGADVIVNMDADNQYRGADITRIVAPILERRADVVIGDRQTDTISHFSPLKRLMQRWGSSVVRRISGTAVADATSGFRAFGRRAAYQMFVHNRFTYTLETIVQGGRSGLIFEDVKLETNPKRRESRLARSTAHYVRQAAGLLVRAHVMYRPVQTFAYGAATLFACGAFLCARFLFFYLRNPAYSGHTQSLVAGVGFATLSFLVALVAMLSDLLGANRRLLEDMLVRVRRLDAGLARAARARGETIEGVQSTGAAPWRKGPTP
jgi:glycosyltransferase involved in cell wall biosynthesis